MSDPSLASLAVELLNNIARQLILEEVERGYGSVMPMELLTHCHNLDTVFEDFCHLIRPFNACNVLRTAGIDAYFKIMSLPVAPNCPAADRAASPSLLADPRGLEQMSIAFSPYFNRIRRLSISIYGMGVRRSMESSLSSFSANPPPVPHRLTQLTLFLYHVPKAAQVHLPKAVEALRGMGARRTVLCVGCCTGADIQQRCMETDSDDHVAETLLNAKQSLQLSI